MAPKALVPLCLLAGSAQARHPSPKKCSECVEVVGALAQLAQNETSLEHIISSLQADCAKAGLKPALLKLCDEMAKDAVDLVPYLYKELGSIAWDASGVCAGLGNCLVPCCKTKAQPEQIHLAMGQTESSVSVMWTTGSLASSSVQWGLAGGALSMSAQGVNSTYHWAGWEGQLHTVTMHGLQPDTQYAYRVGDQALGWSDVLNFSTVPANVGTKQRPLRLLQIGDMGFGTASDHTVAAMLAHINAGSIDLILHNGDVGYADGEQKHWDVFLNKIEPIASRIPYMVSPGNHEFWFNFSAYKHRFSMPSPPGIQNMYWSASVGPLHLTSMDTEDILDTAWMSKSQAQWLQADLAKAINSTWKIAMGHRPLYCTQHGTQCGLYSELLRARAEDHLLDHKVDLVIQSHEHSYERTWPTANSKAVQTNYSHPTAPVYVVNGAAGNREGNAQQPCDTPWCAKALKNVSYAIITIADMSLTYQLFDSADGTIIDTFTIEK